MNSIGKIVAVLVVVFLGLAGYQYLKKEQAPTASVGGIVTENFDSTSSGDNQEFLRVLKNLENVSLDGEFLTSAAFMNLRDFSVELQDQPRGRSNPFRPINPFEADLAASVSGLSAPAPNATTTASTSAAH